MRDDGDSGREALRFQSLLRACRRHKSQPRWRLCAAAASQDRPSRIATTFLRVGPATSCNRCYSDEGLSLPLVKSLVAGHRGWSYSKQEQLSNGTRRDSPLYQMVSFSRVPRSTWAIAIGRIQRARGRTSTSAADSSMFL